MRTPFTRALVLLLCIILPGLAGAGWMYRFNNGESLSRTQLNANLAHLHDTQVGGHGERLLDEDVHPDAKLQFSKFASSALFPKAWGTTGVCATTVAGTSCTVRGGFGVEWVKAISATDGQYYVCISPSLSLLTAAAGGNSRTVVSVTTDSWTFRHNCNFATAFATAISGFDCPANHLFRVYCVDPWGVGAVDSAISFAVFTEIP
jgi:hypothetical protein